ncbi:MAG TPA: two-component system sensor histidine kinase KdpD [Ideonella sp.]|nr:two-component system sensor histidine kinase KdpD [Ideonella sp.]
MNEEPTRPDPDELLARAQAASERASRGKLKIFFGASAGVGKTYAMLKAAQQLRRQQVDVVAGLVETHGRAETAELLLGLEVLPQREVNIKGRVLHEFDLDAALKRRPGVLLVDELAHSNAAGSRHPRRWQDIDELLDAGIDVITTVNVQHIESLNDVVGGITGIRVWETVPDHVFDEAHEVVLVDLPTDDLLHRLKAGKIYLPEQAAAAVQNFFRKGNLMALRELALRRTAERVDDDVRSYRREMSGADGREVWHVSDALLVCVGPDPGAEKLVRSAGRRAGRSNAPWHAVYVETPALQQLPEQQRSDVLRTLKLAESLGAQTATLSAQDAAAAVINYAREHNLGTVVAGRSPGRRAWRWLRRWLGREHFVERIAELAPDIELMVVARDDKPQPPRPAPSREGDGGDSHSPWPGYGWALASSAAVTLLATPLMPFFDLANIVMLFMLVVVLVAARFGRRPALASAVLNVLAFDFFFVTPRLSFSVSDAQYLLTFAVMMIVGLVVGQLTASLRYQARVSRYREDRARSLYEMARELGKALTQEQVAEIGDRTLEAAFRAKVSVLFPDLEDRLAPASMGMGADPELDLGLAQWAFDHAEAAGSGTDTLPASRLLYVPLRAPMRTRGVIAIEPPHARLLLIPEQRQLLDTYAALVAIAIERVHFVTVAQDTLVSMESERLRNSLLAALSHDLRTPLTAVVGMSETLAQALARDASPHAASARAITEQSLRTAQLVSNLLDMARLQAGAVTLRRDWQSLEELAGSALRSVQPALDRHPVRVELPPELPLLYGDAVLLERVLANLFENAAKYTPAGTAITLGARHEGAWMVVEVGDEGPGLPPGEHGDLFRKFSRGEKESSTPGVGLGLAICRAIVQAHGGEVSAHNRPPPQHGAVLRWTLPYREAPLLDLAEPADT